MKRATTLVEKYQEQWIDALKARGITPNGDYAEQSRGYKLANARGNVLKNTSTAQALKLAQQALDAAMAKGRIDYMPSPALDAHASRIRFNYRVAANNRLPQKYRNRQLSAEVA